MMTYVAIAAGGAAGGALRYLVGGIVDRRFAGSFPWGTWVVNATGALLIGLFAGLIARYDWPSGAWSGALVIGLCGSYTTVSSFSLQALYLFRGERHVAAATYVLSSVAACLLATLAGYVLAGSGAPG